jgi:hypothetical protein
LFQQSGVGNDDIGHFLLLAQGQFTIHPCLTFGFGQIRIAFLQSFQLNTIITDSDTNGDGKQPIELARFKQQGNVRNSNVTVSKKEASQQLLHQNQQNLGMRNGIQLSSPLGILKDNGTQFQSINATTILRCQKYAVAFKDGKNLRIDRTLGMDNVGRFLGLSSSSSLSLSSLSSLSSCAKVEGGSRISWQWNRHKSS